MVLSDCSLLMCYQAFNDSSPSPAGITALLSQRKAEHGRHTGLFRDKEQAMDGSRKGNLSFPPLHSCGWIGPVLQQVVSEVR